VGANIPISTVAHPDFIKLVEELNPAVALPSYRTMRTAIIPHAVIFWQNTINFVICIY
jgi:hypothetical protein